MSVSQSLSSLESLGNEVRDRILARPILSSALATLASGYILTKLYHASLRRQITYIPQVGESARKASVDVAEVQSLPEKLLEHPRDFRVVHDKAVKVVPGCGGLLWRGDAEGIFTRLVRTSMKAHAASPQAWMIWYALRPELRETFRSGYIEDLDFKEGDVVCGIWEVVKRDAAKVELKMKVPRELEEKIGPAKGLLVVSLRARGDGAVFASETVQFIEKRNERSLPLEGRFARWLHEVMTWTLLLKGAIFLERVAREEKA